MSRGLEAKWRGPTELHRDTCFVIHHDTVELPDIVTRESMLLQLGVTWMRRCAEAREDNWDAAANGLAPIERCFSRNKQAFDGLIARWRY